MSTLDIPQFLTCFAEIDPVKKNVLRVIVADQEFIDSGVVGDPKNWIETSQNPLHKRKVYAGVGYVYDSETDDFVPPAAPKETP